MLHISSENCKYEILNIFSKIIYVKYCHIRIRQIYINGLHYYCACIDNYYTFYFSIKPEET